MSQTQNRSPRQSSAVREAVAAIKAQHRVSETSAYAMLIREAIAAQDRWDASPPADELPRQRRPLAS